MADAFDSYNEVNQLLQKEGERRWVYAANCLAEYLGSPGGYSSATEAKKDVEEHFFWLLENDGYLEAAVLTWGLDRFNPRPQCVKDIYRCFKEHSHLMVQGASGMSKTYTLIGLYLLDWARDPYHTAVRLASMSREHLQSNLFSTLLMLHKSSAIKLPGESDKALFLGMDTNSGNGCFKGLAFPKDESITGRFMSFKIYKRDGLPHPVFGKSSRVRILLDEFNKMSDGVVRDLNSVESQIFDKEHVKICAAYNPVDVTHIAYQIAEPRLGWSTVDPEQNWEWQCKWKNWYLLRLDGLQSENVKSRLTVIEGLLTWQAFEGYLSKGDSSADYWSFGRGWFPVQGAYNTIFSRDSLQKSRLIPIYERDVVEIAAVDGALINDSTMFAKARYGPAIGFVRQSGERVLFDAGQKKYVLFLESIIKIPGATDEWDLAQKIRDVAKQLKVQPEWLAVDKTGNGSALYNALHRIYGGLLGIMWSQKASEIKMLADDMEVPQDGYATCASEMWFCTKKWVDRAVCYISPAVPESPLFDELTSRRRRDNKSESGKVQVETKAEWRARGHDKSPDSADAFIMLCQLIRQRHGTIPGSNTDESTDKPKSFLNLWTRFGIRQPTEEEQAAVNVVDDQVSLDEIGEYGTPEEDRELEEDEDQLEEAQTSWLTNLR